MTVILLDEDSRHILRLWLTGRERIKSIKYYRWCAFLSCTTAVITECELGAILDCTSPALLTLLRLPDDEKEELLKSMRWQVAKDGAEV